jgi:two-component system NtrC family sensor kinase
VDVARSAASAIQHAAQVEPDLVIANLELPGLSGKDLLVALSSQGIEIPTIVVGRQGMEADLIQAFRIGAADYLLLPVREAEVVAAVERVLRQVRIHKEREVLERKLQKTNEELQGRVRELTTILAIGKAVTSIPERRSMLSKIIEGAAYITEADCGWLLVREGPKSPFTLSALHNLPEKAASRINQPWDDGLSSLVAVSGETLTIHGEPMARFKISQLGKSALVAPIKVRKDVTGLLVVLRKAPTPFSPTDKSLLEAIADYASIALVNVRLFQNLEEKARSLQQSLERAQIAAKEKEDLLCALQDELSQPLSEAIKALEALFVGDNARLNTTQRNVLRKAKDKLQRAYTLIEPIPTKQERV